MKNIIKHISYLAALALLLVGCTNNNNKELAQQSGELEFLSISVDSDIVDLQTSENSASSQVKASPTKADEIAEKQHIFRVIITNTTTGTVEADYPDHTMMPLTVVLAPGTYKVVAQTTKMYNQVPAEGTVGFEMPYYYAEQEVEILPAEKALISLTASQTSFGVRVKYSDKFKELFPCIKTNETYSTTIISSEGERIKIDRLNDSTAYFRNSKGNLNLSYQIEIKEYDNSGNLLIKQGTVQPFPSSLMPAKSAYIYNLTIKAMGQ